TLNNIIEECRLRLHQLMNVQPLTSNVQPPTSNENATSPSTKNLSPNNMFKELIFGSAQRSQELQMNWIFTLTLDGH
ncbi:10101_t:CDS:1, partial [Dentiscutata erythropus]